jgi:hypothetical protein
MIADSLVCLLLVLVVTFGLSRPLVGWFGLGPAETVVAGAAFSLILAWAYAWAVFTSGAPLGAYAVLPVAACVFLAVGRRSLARLLADPAARDLAVGQLIVTAWCVAWLSFVTSYSGGAWTGDFVEHWQRALYFMRNWPDSTFIEIYQLPARPPLSNVLTGAFMQMTHADFAHYQVIMGGLSSLAYLPVGLLAGRYGGRRAIRVAAALVMLNPLFVQNATYPWTKLHAAFFILSGLYFFLRVQDNDAHSPRAGIACALCLGGAVVTHYSAGPYVVVLAAAWVACGFGRHWDAAFLRTTGLAAAAGACVLAPWFLWSISQFGFQGTFLSNSSISMMQKAPGSPPVVAALNFRDTFVPPQLRGFHGTLFRQTSSWGTLRDQLFLVYQLNPLLALGSVGWLAVAVQAVRRARAAPRRQAFFWAASLAGVLLLSFAAYGDRDHYGIGHICLQSTVLGGLAFLASQWGAVGRAWRIALIAGCAVDFTLGIALQFAVENFAFDRWFDPSRSFAGMLGSYAVVTQGNLRWKIIAHLTYFADILQTPPALVLALLGAVLWMALLRVRKLPVDPSRP